MFEGEVSEKSQEVNFGFLDIAVFAAVIVNISVFDWSFCLSAALSDVNRSSTRLYKTCKQSTMISIIVSKILLKI
jgi:hypothetical protein